MGTDPSKDYLRPAVFDRWNRRGGPSASERWVFSHPVAAAVLSVAIFFFGFVLTALIHWALAIAAVAVTAGIGRLLWRHFVEQAELYEEWQAQNPDGTSDAGDPSRSDE